MKVQETEINKQVVTQIFMSKEEAENQANIEKIRELKEKNSNVVIFSAGDIETSQVLKCMLQVMKNKVTIK